MNTRVMNAYLIYHPRFGWFIDYELGLQDETADVVAIEDEFGPEEPDAGCDVPPERMAEILATRGVRLVTSDQNLSADAWWTGRPLEGRVSAFFISAD